MRVHLIVTGDLEQIALAAVLEAYFRGLGADVSFTTQKVYAATSNRLPAPSAGPVPAVVQRLAGSMVTDTLVRSDSRKPLPDLVVAVDDLELANLDQPDVVVAWIRRGICVELERRFSAVVHRERAAEQLRSRCSFHLLVPLVEAYFFGDVDALAAAGVPAMRSPCLRGEDLELFETVDDGFLQEALARRAGRPAWWHEERHPKKYLEYLVRPKIYDETVDGVRALRRLSWSRLAERVGGLWCLRALMQDLAESMDVVCPVGAGARSGATWPDLRGRASARVLRNL